MRLLDTDVLVDIRRGLTPAEEWYMSLTEDRAFLASWQWNLSQVAATKRSYSACRLFCLACRSFGPLRQIVSVAWSICVTIRNCIESRQGRLKPQQQKHKVYLRSLGL
jgi:hypothetical protein